MKRIIYVLSLVLATTVSSHANWIPKWALSKMNHSKTQTANSKAIAKICKGKADAANSKSFLQRGIASWYGKGDSILTANGEHFNYNLLTAAHKSLPFNSLVLVKNLVNNRSVLVRINDRGPYVSGRIIDLSTFAAKQIGLTVRGVAPVEIRVIE